MSSYTTFKDLGINPVKIPNWSWRKPRTYESRNNGLTGKEAIYKGKKDLIVQSFGKTCILLQNDRVPLKEIKVHLPDKKRKTIPELLEELKQLYPGCTLHKSRGCQLHGDVDLILTYNGETKLIPWNY